MDLESKLRDYRVKRNRETKINNLKNKVKIYFQWKQKETKEQHVEKEMKENLLNGTCEVKPVVEETNGVNDNECENKQWFKYGFYVTCLLAWILSYYIFIQLQFGTIFLIVSALVGICVNTRTGPKDPTEVSAYSVFNQNCESIDGTLKAEQFEREIRYGAQSVH